MSKDFSTISLGDVLRTLILFCCQRPSAAGALPCKALAPALCHLPQGHSVTWGG